MIQYTNFTGQFKAAFMKQEEDGGLHRPCPVIPRKKRGTGVIPSPRSESQKKGPGNYRAFHMHSETLYLRRVIFLVLEKEPLLTV